MSDLRVDRQGAVAIITIDRPPFNYFDEPLLRGIADALAQTDADASARCSILRAEGKVFCAGADFRSASGGSPQQVYGQASRIFARQKPLIAAVNGPAIGGGLGLALAADFRVATTQARFQANFVRIGLHPGFALTVAMPRLLGPRRASDLLLTGRSVGGTEALDIGLADRFAEPGELDSAALAFAEEIASGAPLAIKSIRAALSGDLAAEAAAAMDRELAAQVPLFASADFREGVAAFAEKRRANFEGR